MRLRARLEVWAVNGVRVNICLRANDKRSLAVMLRQCDPDVYVISGRFEHHPPTTDGWDNGTIRTRSGRITAMVADWGQVWIVNHPRYKSCIPARTATICQGPSSPAHAPLALTIQP